MKTFSHWVKLETVTNGGFNGYKPSILLSLDDKCFDKLYIGNAAGNTKIILVERERKDTKDYEFFFGVYEGKSPGETQGKNDLDYIIFFEHVKGIVKYSQVKGEHLEGLISEETEKSWEKHFRPV